MFVSGKAGTDIFRKSFCAGCIKANHAGLAEMGSGGIGRAGCLVRTMEPYLLYTSALWESRAECKYSPVERNIFRRLRQRPAAEQFRR